VKVLQFVLDQGRAIAAFEEMAFAPGFEVEGPRDAGAEVLHDYAKIGIWGGDDKMVVIAHQHEGMNSGCVEQGDFEERVAEDLPGLCHGKLKPVAVIHLIYDVVGQGFRSD
jgi:hypothetical protein